MKRARSGVDSLPVLEPLEARLLLAAVRPDEAWLAGMSFLNAGSSATLTGGVASPVSLTAPGQTDPQPVYGDDGSVLAYVVEPGTEGFVIVAGDTDVRPILGYSCTGRFAFEDTPENALLDLVRSDVRDSLNLADLRTPEAEQWAASNRAQWLIGLSEGRAPLLGDGTTDAAAANEDSDTVSVPLTGGTPPTPGPQWGPLITFPTFNQTFPYNSQCPNDPTGARSYTGCTPTAVTEMLYYWEYPSSLSFTDATDRYTSSAASGDIAIDGHAGLRDFPTFAELNTALASIDYDLSSAEIACLMFATGIKLRADYSGNSSFGTSASVTDWDFTSSFGFVSAQEYDGWDSSVRDEAIESIQAGRPVFLGTWDGASGHSIIADGYRDTGEFHLNLGWGGNSDAWYFLPNPYGSGYRFTTITEVISDIAPLAVDSPYGGEALARGSTARIAWDTSSGVGPYVSIELYKGGVLDSIITPAAPNNGSYDWAIPMTQAAGSDYRIRIASTSNVHHFAWNDADFAVGPGLTTTATVLSYVQSAGWAPVDSGITVSDEASPTLASATVRITGNFVSGQDVLGVIPQAGIIDTFDATTGTLTMTGVASLAVWQAELRTVAYINTAGSPSLLPRTVSFTVNDGRLPSNTATRVVNITTDVAPVVTTTGTTLNYLQGNGWAGVDPGVTVTDSDNPTLPGAWVSISGNYASGQDVLGFNARNGIAGSWNSSTGILTLTGWATLANYQDALRAVAFCNAGATPSVLARTISFCVTDGVLNSNVATRSMTFIADAAPVVTTTAGAVDYPSNANWLAVDPGVSVADSDSPDLRSATAWISGNYTPGQDALGVIDQNGITSIWNASTGTLTMTGSAGIATWLAELRAVAYYNSSANPTPLTRTVSFRVSDGLQNSNAAARLIAVTLANVAPSDISLTRSSVDEDMEVPAVVGALSTTDPDPKETYAYALVAGFGDNVLFQITGNVLQTAALLDYETMAHSCSIKVRTTDSGPGAPTFDKVFTIALIDTEERPVATTTGSPLSYSQAAGWMAVDPGITVTDADNAALVSATARITGNYANGQDILDVVVQPGITDTWDAVTGTLTMTGVASPSVWEAELRAVAYVNASATPNTLPRTVSFKVNDGIMDSHASTRTIHITPDSAPVVTTTAGALSYETSGSWVGVDPGITVSDADSANLAGAAVSLAVNYANGQDVLWFIPQSGITGVWDAAAGRLTLTGISTVSAYQSALRSVGYRNASANPSALARTVSFRVNDGVKDSNTGTRTIRVDVNHAPTGIQASGSAVLEHRAVGTPVGTFSTSDPDAGNTFTYALVSGTGDTDNASFSVSGNQLLTAASLDFEAKSTYSVRLRSTDQDGLPTEKAFVITVTNGNDPPTISGLPDRSLLKNTSLPYTILLPTFAADPNSSPWGGLTYSIGGSTDANCGIRLVSYGNWYVSINPTPNWIGTSDVTVMVSDGEFAATDTFRVTVADAYADLSGTLNPIVLPPSTKAGDYHLVQLQVRNAGNVPAAGFCAMQLWASLDGDLAAGTDDYRLGEIRPYVYIPAGGTGYCYFSYLAPVGIPAGTYDLIARIDSGDNFNESNPGGELNNQAVIADRVVMQNSFVDLTDGTATPLNPIVLQNPTRTGDYHLVELRVRNAGNAAASGFASIQLWASLDGIPGTGGDDYKLSEIRPYVYLPAGSTGYYYFSYLVPGGIPNGTYDLIAVIDSANNFAETGGGGEANNQVRILDRFVLTNPITAAMPAPSALLLNAPAAPVTERSAMAAGTERSPALAAPDEADVVVAPGEVGYPKGTPVSASTQESAGSGATPVSVLLTSAPIPCPSRKLRRPCRNWSYVTCQRATPWIESVLSCGPGGQGRTSWACFSGSFEGFF